MDWGEREEGLTAVETQTGETPQALLNKPELHEWLHWLYDAFWVCCTARPVYDGSVGSIPITAMHAYAEMFGVRGIELRQLLVRTIRALDSVYRSKVNAQIARKVEQDRVDAERKEERGRGG